MAAALAQVKSSSHYIPGSLLQLLGSSAKPIDSLRAFSDVIRQSSACNLLAVGSSSGGNKIRLEHVSDVVKIDAKHSFEDAIVKANIGILQSIVKLNRVRAISLLKLAKKAK